MLSKVWTI